MKYSWKNYIDDSNFLNKHSVFFKMGVDIPLEEISQNESPQVPNVVSNSRSNKITQQIVVVNNNRRPSIVVSRFRDEHQCTSCCLGFLMGWFFNVFAILCTFCAPDPGWYLLGCLCPCLTIIIIVAIWALIFVGGFSAAFLLVFAENNAGILILSISIVVFMVCLVIIGVWACGLCDCSNRQISHV